MTEAEKLLHRTVSRCMNQWSFIVSFRESFRFGAEEARKSMQADRVKKLNDVLHGTEYDILFFGRKEALLRKLPPSEELVAKATETTVREVETAVSAACVVFAHSVLDGAALDYCRVTALVAPRDWESVIEQRRIKLSEIRGLSYDQILEKELAEFFEKELENQSLLKKADHLFARCRPPQKFNPGFLPSYTYDRERLERIDRYRHDVIHGEALESQTPLAEGEVEHLFHTSLFFAGLVESRYKVGLDPFYLLTGKEQQRRS